MSKNKKVKVTNAKPTKEVEATLLRNMSFGANGRKSDYSRVEEAKKELAKVFAKELESWTELVFANSKLKKFKAKHAEEHCQERIVPVFEKALEDMDRLEKKLANKPDILKSRCPYKIPNMPFKEQSEEHQEWVKAKSHYSDIPKYRKVKKIVDGAAVHDKEGNPVIITIGNLRYQLAKKEHIINKLKAEYEALVAAGYKGEYMNTPKVYLGDSEYKAKK